MIKNVTIVVITCINVEYVIVNIPLPEISAGLHASSCKSACKFLSDRYTWFRSSDNHIFTFFTWLTISLPTKQTSRNIERKKATRDFPTQSGTTRTASRLVDRYKIKEKIKANNILPRALFITFENSLHTRYFSNTRMCPCFISSWLSRQWRSDRMLIHKLMQQTSGK